MRPEPTAQPKLIYFAERPPQLDRAGFRARWRAHAKLGMSMPRWRNVARYVHCDSLEMPETSLPSAWCDGVAMIWYRSEENRLAHVTDRSAAPRMKRDEQESFARPVREVAVLSEEHVFKPCEGARYKLFLRVWRKPEQSLEDFRMERLKGHGPRLLQGMEAEGLCRGYVQNHARAESPAASVPPPLCDCVEELACDDAAACVALLRPLLDEDAAEVRAVWTEETLLYSL
ncbi:MAG: EthD domain-containing protein [Rhodovibrionaceae bacterium]